MGGTIPGLVILDYIRNHTEQTRGSKPISNLLPWPLHQLLLPDLLDDERQYWKYKLNEPFPSNLLLGHDVCTEIEIPTKTLAQSGFLQHFSQ